MSENIFCGNFLWISADYCNTITLTQSVTRIIDYQSMCTNVGINHTVQLDIYSLSKIINKYVNCYIYLMDLT